MNTVLAVQTCQRCSGALLRHWPFFLRQEAQYNVVVTTTDTQCDLPDGTLSIPVGKDGYIDGPLLPSRLVDTISKLLDFPADIIMIAEYDTLICNRIEVEKLDQIAAHHAGNITPVLAFYHNPWVFDRWMAERFIEEGQKVIDEHLCHPGKVEASPDVFFGRVVERLDQPVQTDLWREFSRNSLDCEGDLERARVAYISGMDVLHGIKTQSELDYITT